jgi:hypothetical protein
MLFRRPGARTQIDLGVHFEVVPLGAISSEHNLVRRRDYDFGVGLGGRFTGALRHDGRDLLRLDGRRIWIHSLYSAEASHVMTSARLSAAIPVMRMVSVGGDVGLTFRQSTYRSEPQVHTRVPQFRAYLIWSPS